MVVRWLKEVVSRSLFRGTCLARECARGCAQAHAWADPVISLQVILFLILVYNCISRFVHLFALHDWIYRLWTLLIKRLQDNPNGFVVKFSSWPYVRHVLQHVPQHMPKHAPVSTCLGRCQRTYSSTCLGPCLRTCPRTGFTNLNGMKAAAGRWRWSLHIWEKRNFD